jgi:hypothetical protein
VRGGFSTARPDLRRRSSSIPGELYPPRKHFYFWAKHETLQEQNQPVWQKAKIPEGLGDSVPPSGAWLLPFVFVREQLCRRLIAERLVGTLVVVKIKIVGQGSEQGCAILEIAGINQFVLERAPQSLDEHMVERAATAIHADGDMTLFEQRQELCRRKL